MIPEVAVERIDRAGTVGQRHVGVGPQQIERIAGKARGLILGPPIEFEQGYMVSRAPSR